MPPNRCELCTCLARKIIFLCFWKIQLTDCLFLYSRLLSSLSPPDIKAMQSAAKIVSNKFCLIFPEYGSSVVIVSDD